MIPVAVVDLMCGCGGMSIGLSQAGASIVGAYDIWDKAVEAYNHNAGVTGTQAHLLDTTNTEDAVSAVGAALNGDGALWQTLISGSLPYSENYDDGLALSFANIVSRVMPDYLILEAMPRFLHSHSYYDVQETLARCGYALSANVYNAALCGVPQLRERAFILGSLNSAVLAELSFATYDQADDHLTIRQYFQDSWTGKENYYVHPRDYSRRHVFSIDEPAPTIREVNRTPSPHIPPHPDNTAPVDKVDNLSTDERLMIQTFPQDFSFPDGVSTTDKERMIGHATPPNMARFLGQCLGRVLGN